MPFTASHVAAVLPLVRTPLVPSALVAGSLVPDLPVFFPLASYANTHSVQGVLLADPALGCIALTLWWVLLAEPLHATAPRALRRRVPAPNPRSALRITGWPRRMLVTYASLVVGAATHVTWDAFTHHGRWGSQHIEWLAKPHGPLLGTTWAQYGSTLLGASVIAAWLVHWWRSTPPRELAEAAAAPRASGPLTWLIPMLAGGAAATVVAYSLPGRGTDLYTVAFYVVSYGTGASVTVAVFLAVGWHVRQRLLRR